MVFSSLLRGSTVRALIKSYLVIGLALLVAALTLTSLRITEEVDTQAVLTTRLLANLAADRIFSGDPQLLTELRDAIDGVAVPMILTSASGLPVFWNPRQVGIPLPEDPEPFAEEDIQQPRDQMLIELLGRIQAYDRMRPPLPVHDPRTGSVGYYLHYGESALSRRLRWLPGLEAMLILAFMGVALLAFRNLKRSEERSLWVGMAKETAHQLGTPLTSMSGWLALLEEGKGDGVERDRAVGELERDHQRLAKVAARFSQIGSRPKLTSGQVDHLVENACVYFRRRLPHLGSHVEIVSAIDAVPATPINAELLEWALENLIKNALDAIDKKSGLIEVGCFHDAAASEICVEVSDNGAGMPLSVQRRVFEPGFSTKESGWGLGLVLVRRIVRDYHGGAIEISRSQPGRGTTMRIRLPAAQVVERPPLP